MARPSLQALPVALVRRRSSLDGLGSPPRHQSQGHGLPNAKHESTAQTTRRSQADSLPTLARLSSPSSPPPPRRANSAIMNIIKLQKWVPRHLLLFAMHS
jgi:hypothetical protein